MIKAPTGIDDGRTARRPVLRKIVAALGVSMVLAAPAARAESPLRPYTARYHVSYRGLSGGEIESSFRHGQQPGLWQYETRVYP
ncbi:MAG TPA: hypothetical protein VFX69_09975, partial [Steroidobacteraceae bacterium]|nr:hypothetical protein [Steroidobacteraceae bacterium]